jgi:NAD(P)-dependent dehydrogenase (short-subunit alcohol dehydrogenase family)
MTWALVTGGAKRLGAEICLKLADEGYNVVVHYNRSEIEAVALADQCRKKGVLAETLHGDFDSLVSTLDFAHRYINKFSDTRILINNVGNYLVKSASKTDYEEWYSIFQSNLHAPFVLIHQLLDPLKHNKGCIINLGIAGLTNLRADKYSTCYSCAKTALWVLTKSLALEFAPYQVRVNMVSPGYLDISEDLPADLSKLPMARTASSAEVTEVIAFLLSDKNAYITGQNIEVAGGVRL